MSDETRSRSSRKPMSAKEVFVAAIALPTEQRTAFLDHACLGDAALRARVDALLSAYTSAAGFLDAPTAGATVGAGPSILASQESAMTTALGGGMERPGAIVGRYKLLQQIGEGGFGVVYMAEQREPVSRRVALKIIKLGMDTKQVVARFEAERQALAMMDHPNIARVLDGGATETGRPFFVMELVKGEPITTYCDRERLTIAQRLELFGQVCQAVQHAHQKGVIHRDLKPSNVLVSTVDGRPHAKVIDFGIAKATAARLTERTLFTAHEQLIGTPQYMSPEQAAGSLDIDTRSDVYSLGVLLYELLTGLTPFDPQRLRSAAYAEMQRIIREVEPPKPSTRISLLRGAVATGRLPGALAAGGGALGAAGGAAAPADGGAHGAAAGAPAADAGALAAPGGAPAAAADAHAPAAVESPGPTLADVAARRQIEPRKLGLLVRGDLDWIAMKCLEKDRQRRYETASSLAADVQRHLRGDPIIAAPPSVAYRVRKFVRRYRGAVIAAGLVTGVLLLGILGTTSGLVWAEYQRRQAVLARRAEKEQMERALAAETEATAQRNAAEHQREAAVFQAYAANVGPALTAVEHGDTWGAQRYLENCPEALRNWEWRYASAACDQSLRTIAMDSPTLTMSPTRSQIIASCADGTIRVMDVPPMAQLAALEHPTRSGLQVTVVRSPTINLSPDGTRFVSRRAACEARAILWDAENLREVSAFRTRDDFHGTIRFSPSSRLLLVLDWTGAVSAVHDARTGTALATIDLGAVRGKPRGVFTADEKHVVIASCYEDNLLRVFRVEDGAQVRSIAAHQAPIAQLIPSPDGTLIVTVAEAGDARIWDAATLDQLSALSGINATAGAVWSPDSQRLALHRDDRLSICIARTGVEAARSDSESGRELIGFSGDGRKLITRHPENMRWALAEVWDTMTGRQILRIKRENVFNTCVAAFSPDSSHVAIGFDDGAIELWGVEHGDLRATLRGHSGSIESLAFSRDGSRLLSAARDGVREWAVKSPEPMVQLRPTGSPIRYAATFAPDSRRVIAPYPVYQPVHEAADTVDTDEDTVSYFDAATGEEIARIEVGLWTYHDDGYYPDILEVSGDGTKLAVGSTKAGLGRVFDIDTGFPVAELRWPKFPRISSSFNVELSPDFGTAAVWRDDLHLTDKGRTTIESIPLQLVDTSSGAVTHDLSDGGPCRPNWNGTPVAFSPDGSRLISACQDESGAVIWDIATGARQLRLEGRATVNSLCFVANGSRVAAVGNDGILTIYDAHSGDVVNSFNWRGGETYGVQWSPDESRLLVCDDNWLRLAQADDGREVARIRFPRPLFATFSPDQTRLLALEGGLSAHVFDARPAADRFAEEQRYAAAAEQGRRSAGEALASSGQRIQPAAAQIRADADLPIEVRRTALQALFEECSRRRALVLALFEKHVFADDVIAAIEADSSLEPGVRADMIETARRRGDHPVPLNRAAWKRVTPTDGTAAEYELGLRAAERAVAELPTLGDLLEMESHEEQNEYWHWECDRFQTLGIALYRNNRLDAALQTLTRYIELRKKLGRYEDPANAAFLAMSQFKLGRVEDAGASLARLRELMRERRHATNEVHQTFLAEAESLIEGLAPSPAGAPATQRSPE